MKQLFSWLTICLWLCALPLLTACVDEEEFDNTPQGNFEALWKIIDEHYCFLNYKHEAYGLDWQQVYDKYRVRIDNDMSNKQLFEVLAGMLGELRDGHVNLNAAHDMGRYWSWYEDYPTNFSDTLLRRYMGTDYQIASGIKYKILDDNIGYMRYESFNDGIGEGNLDEVFKHMLLCRGLIIDIRNNSGGMLTNARVCHAFMKQYDNVVPLWGMQTLEQLEQWLALADENPDLDAEMEAFIAKERKELSGSFCRSCGYCMPCPMGIEIRNCARMNMLLRRSPWQQYMTDEWYAKMHKIEDCIECRSCASKCPYQLDTPNLLKYMLKDYDEFYASHKDLV